ncbi:unnamed protein product [Cuscuta europaea]|uniref:Uncharacterized protein n=2 Tax=Cuscuta europaea TaxID=41803 RepID=A0A9P0YTI8_CUSEU|nr:unnamed protein product [Cuscuta europaea]
MDCHLEAERISRDQQRKTLGDKLVLGEPKVASADLLQADALKNVGVAPPKFEKARRKKHIHDSEEVVRYMSNLPSYLERGKFHQEKAFNVGVLEWNRLETWQKKHNQQIPCKISSKIIQPSVEKVDTTPKEFNKDTKLHDFIIKNRKSQDIKDNNCTISMTKGMVATFNGKNIKENAEAATEVRNPSPTPPKANTIMDSQIGSTRKVDEKCLMASSSRLSQPSMYVGKILTKPPRRIKPESNKPTNAKEEHEEAATAKLVRGPSPTHRFRIQLSGKGLTSTAKDVSNAGSKQQERMDEDDSSIFHPLTCDKSNDLNSRVKRSSPLRRLLLDPLLNPRRSTSSDHHHFPRLMKGCKTVEIDNDTKHRPLRKQALFQVSMTSGVPLFKFAVENEGGEILVATMQKKKKDSWIYSICNVCEMKRKDKSNGYISSVIAQMKVSDDVPFSGCHSKTVREFVLFPAEEMKESGQPTNELAAIIASGKEEDIRKLTVILPGGNHGLPGKGCEPSPLIERWKSGGSCDCGGWDLGCKLTVLAANRSEVVTRGSFNSAIIHSTPGRFELFHQGEDVEQKKPVFSFSAFKEGIFSVEYSSSLARLQAFSICIAILENLAQCVKDESISQGNMNK